MRIVSLLPAATEMCFALHLGNDLVGVSPECDYPAAARSLPAMSKVRLDYEGKSSSETSRMVGESLAAGSALYEVDEQGLREARPDLLLTQGLCEVCAPAMDDVSAVAKRLPKVPKVLSLDPHGLKDILDDMLRIGHTCGIESEAQAVVARLKERIEAVAACAARTHARPPTLCLEWLDPPFAAGHWVPEMVALAGGEPTFVRPGEKARRLDGKEIALAAPEVTVLMPCGYHIDRVRHEASLVASIPGWRDLPAVRDDRVWLVDASSHFNRPGPRVVDGLEILAHVLHPEAFPKTWPARDLQHWTG